jgi:hypothetical protein
MLNDQGASGQGHADPNNNGRDHGEEQDTLVPKMPTTTIR